MSKVIGIDLGSVNSAVAVMEGGKPTIIINDEGARTTPSVISFADNQRKVGGAAKRQAITKPKETVVLIKRFMGGTYDEVQKSLSHVNYDVVNEAGKPRVKINDRLYTPEELSAMILTKMKSTAENFLGTDVKDAVITVPAFFDNAAKEATKRAGELAGLNVLRLVAEPTAAILASNLDMDKGGKYMVADYGGATCDFSIADISDKVVEILASNGDVYLGGSDIDKLFSDYLIGEFKNQTGIDVSNDPIAMSRVFESAEKAKIELSTTTATEINLPYLGVKDGQPQHLMLTVTRAKFEQIIDPEIQKVMKCAKEALAQSKLSASDLNGIVLVGGSTRIPKVQEELKNTFGAPLIKNVNPDEVVALGAAVQGDILNGGSSDLLLLDVTAIPYGIETMGGVMTTLVEANTTIPTGKEQVFTTAVDNQPSVTINVYQGFRPMVKDNKKIGEFNLDGIMPAGRGVPQILVKFDIDANGILKVSATDKATGKEQHISISDASGLSQSDIERMKAEAEKFAEEDKRAKQDADSLNKADATIIQVEKLLKDNADKLQESDKSTIETELNKLKDAYGKRDVAACNESVDRVMKAFQDVSSRLYGQQQQQGAGQPFDFVNELNKARQNQQPGNTKQNVDDVTFEEVK